MAEKQKAYLKKRHQKSSPKKKKSKEIIVEVQEDKKPSAFLTFIKRVGNHWQMICIIPLLILIGFVPLIVYGKIIKLTSYEEMNWTGGIYHVDFFSWYKSRWLLVITFILFLIFIILLITKKIKFKKEKFWIPLSVYILFSVISTIFAVDQVVAQRGFMAMFQGIYVIISYGLIVLIVYHLVESKKQIKAIMGAFIFLGIMIGIIGFYQYIEKDIIQSDFGLNLIVSNKLEAVLESLSFNVNKYDIYATFGNTNFVGSFAALMIPLAFSLYLYSKGLIFQTFSLIFLGLMLLVGYGSNSRAGIIGVIVSLVLIMILFRRLLIKKPLKIMFPFMVMIVFGFLLNVVTEGKVIRELKSMNLLTAVEDAKVYKEQKVFVTRLEIEDYTLYLETEEEGIKLVWSTMGITPYDLEENILEVNQSGNTYTFKDEKYHQFSLTLFTTDPGFTMSVYGRKFNVYYTDEGLMVVGSSSFLVNPTMPAIVNLLDNYGTLFSGRAFIWSRSIPLLKDYFIIGSGPDHFPIVYPQNDIAGKLNYMGLHVIVDKPHNMYLQTGINTGVISLLGMIILFGFYIVDSSKIYLKKYRDNYVYVMGIACFSGVFAYLAAGMFNDQVLSVAPLFYVMLSLGYAINFMIKRDVTSKDFIDI